jgi:hypothetical protein
MHRFPFCVPLLLLLTSPRCPLFSVFISLTLLAFPSPFALVCLSGGGGGAVVLLFVVVVCCCCLLLFVVVVVVVVAAAAVVVSRQAELLKLANSTGVLLYIVLDHMDVLLRVMRAGIRACFLLL